MSSMAKPSDQDPRRKGKKVRVAFRRNRGKRRRIRDVTEKALAAEDYEVDAERDERIVAKGDLSRQRTIIVDDDAMGRADDWKTGTVVAMRGL